MWLLVQRNEGQSYNDAPIRYITSRDDFLALKERLKNDPNLPSYEIFGLNREFQAMTVGGVRHHVLNDDGSPRLPSGEYAHPGLTEDDDVWLNSPETSSTPPTRGVIGRRQETTEQPNTSIDSRTRATAHGLTWNY